MNKMEINWHVCCNYRNNRITPIMLADLSSAPQAGLDTPRLSKKVPSGFRRDPQSSNLLTDDLEANCEKYASNLAFIEGEREWTYAQFDAYANKVAHWALSHGCKRGDTVGIFVRNRLEYVALWYGLSKVGVIPALINFQLQAKALAHCISISEAKLLIVGRRPA